jgi:hypothetical protein
VEADKSRVESRDAVLAAFVLQRDRDYFLQKAKSLDESKTAGSAFYFISEARDNIGGHNKR